MKKIVTHNMMKILGLYFFPKVEKGKLVLREIDQLTSEELYRLAGYAIPEDLDNLMCISKECSEYTRPSIEYHIIKENKSFGNKKTSTYRISNNQRLYPSEQIGYINVRFWREKTDRSNEKGYRVRITSRGSVSTFKGESIKITTYNQALSIQYLFSLHVSLPMLELAGKTPIQAGIAKRQS